MPHLADIWAKSPPQPGAAGETLQRHTRRTWENFLSCRERAPALHQLCGAPRLWLRAALAVLLHDVGKCCAGFQAMLRGQASFRERHEVLSVAALSALVGDLSSEDLPWVAAAILSHHEDLPAINARYRPKDEFLNLPDGLSVLASELTADFYRLASELVKEELLPRLVETEFAELATTLANCTALKPEDPVERTRQLMNRIFDLYRRIEAGHYQSAEALAGRLLRGLLVIADHSASAHVSIGYCERLASTAGLLTALQRRPEELFEHQRSAMAVAGNAILIAPTGSGKTEAGLLWAAAQMGQAGGRPVLFYVLPYQASLNAMRQRLGLVLGDQHVALQHSHALQALYKAFAARDYSPQEAERLARREAAVARLHAAPVKLLTPYQLLRGAFQLRGHEAIWAEAACSLMILDELHAYEPRRLGMILAVLAHLSRDLGARLLVMSATLPERLVRLLQEALGRLEVIRSSAQTFAQFRRHRLFLVNDDLLSDSVLERAAADWRSGLSVLMVCNTVRRAQQLWSRMIQQAGERVMLLHGRFHAEDRSDKEVRLLRLRTQGQPQPSLLVSTQVVEVSLDIDFDVLYSDPAPLEALIQRFGRVNRRRLCRERNVFVSASLPAASPIYDGEAVRLALEALAPFDRGLLDEQRLQGGLDGVYSGQFGQTWEASVRKAWREFERDVLASLKPFRSDDRLEEMFERIFDGIEVLPAGLWPHYRELSESEPLRAPGLLVPITSRQYRMLKAAGRLRWEQGVCVADCPYSSELGLELPSQALDDGL